MLKSGYTNAEVKFGLLLLLFFNIKTYERKNKRKKTKR